MERHVEVGEEPPKEVEAPTDNADGRGGVSLLTEDSSGRRPLLGNRHGAQKLQELPRTSPNKKQQLEAPILSLATMAGQENGAQTHTVRPRKQTTLPETTQ